MSGKLFTPRIRLNACIPVTENWKRRRSAFPSGQALLKALYPAAFEATKRWTQPIHNWGQAYGEMCIMYEGRLPIYRKRQLHSKKSVFSVFLLRKKSAVFYFQKK